MSSVLPLSGDRTGPSPDGRKQASTLQAHAGYRPDIEGLRGIAVLSVLAVHSFPQWIRGGFIGVDIFFVLSGFLITGVLFRSLEAGRFSYMEFYKRRALRIFPALCLVLFAWLVFRALLFPSIGWPKETGHFGLILEAKPLLHLRSLGIEAMFYLVWPLAAVFLFKRRRWAPWIICASLLTWLLLNIVVVADEPTADFFLSSSTPFWELMVGALLACLTPYRGGEPVAWLRGRVPTGSRRHLADALAVIGLLLLMGAVWLADTTDRLPRWWALLPTLGSFALLAAGPGAWVNRHILSQSILRFYGAVSYPLCLWHGPLLSVPVLMGIPLTNEVRVMILIGSVVLAALTYDLLEKPIRFGSSVRRMS
ncbi:MAG: acyltransferase [Pseudomonadota bacterium]